LADAAGGSFADPAGTYSYPVWFQPVFFSTASTDGYRAGIATSSRARRMSVNFSDRPSHFFKGRFGNLS